MSLVSLPDSAERTPRFVSPILATINQRSWIPAGLERSCRHGQLANCAVNNCQDFGVDDLSQTGH